MGAVKLSAILLRRAHVITSLKKTRETSAGILEWTAVTLAGVIATASILRFAAPSAAYCPATAPIVMAEQSGTQAETAAIIKDMMRHD